VRFPYIFSWWEEGKRSEETELDKFISIYDFGLRLGDILS
jgi:hypothetical protein